MRIMFLVSTLLLPCFAYAKEPMLHIAPSPTGTLISVSASSVKTRFAIRDQAGNTNVIWLTRDTTVAPKTQPARVKIVGEIKGVAIIFVDTYPSMPGGMSYCQSGEEQFLRIISIAKNPAKETFRVKTTSCRDNIELASPGIEWTAPSSTLHIHWLMGPVTKGKPEEKFLRIKSDGQPEQK